MPPMQGSTETCEGVLYSVLNCDFQLGHLEFIILFGIYNFVGFIFYMNYAVA